MIIKAKMQNTDYIQLTLDNGIVRTIPKVDGNIEYEEYKEWLTIDGNILEPEFTQEELKQQVINTKIQEYKAYLASTDYIITKIAEAQALNKDVASLLTIYEDQLLKREEARTFINANS